MSKKLLWLFYVVILESALIIALSLFWFFWVLVPEAHDYYAMRTVVYVCTAILAIVFSILAIKQYDFGFTGIKLVFYLVLLLFVHYFYTSSQMHLHSHMAELPVGIAIMSFVWGVPVLGLYWLRGKSNAE